MSLPPPVLRDRLSVQAVEDGQVAVTVILPPELVKDYCRFLDSLSSFFAAIQHQSVAAQAQAKATASDLDQRAEDNLASYRARVVASFDRYTAQGLGRKEAITAIAAELRAAHHPWCSFDQVRVTLVESGRGGRFGRPPRGKS